MANQIKKRNGYNTWWFSRVTNRVTNRISDGGSEHLFYITMSLDHSDLKKWNLFDAFKKYFHRIHFITAPISFAQIPASKIVNYARCNAMVENRF